MTNNNQVNWDEVPEDVEAVVTFTNDQPSYYKITDGVLMGQYYRGDIFDWSYYKDVDHLIKHFGDRFHLRPLPITQPTPEPPESTQVESSEVEATTTPEFDWSSVEDDVEAVLTFENAEYNYYKKIDGALHVQSSRCCEYRKSGYMYEDIRKTYGDRLKLRPPATTTPKDIGLNAAYDIYKKVAINFKPDADMYDIFTGVGSKPSILTILQEAQQSILKHHGVTGTVKFTVACSE